MAEQDLHYGITIEDFVDVLSVSINSIKGFKNLIFNYNETHLEIQ